MGSCPELHIVSREIFPAFDVWWKKEKLLRDFKTVSRIYALVLPAINTVQFSVSSYSELLVVPGVLYL